MLTDIEQKQLNEHEDYLIRNIIESHAGSITRHFLEPSTRSARFKLDNGKPIAYYVYERNR